MEKSNAYIWNLTDGNDDPICEAAKETERERTDIWSLWEKDRVDDLRE